MWSIFGALFVGELLTPGLSVQPITYAVLSLTVIRMVPVAVALIGTHLRPSTVAFMGWFGPRGLASVVFTLIALEEFEHAGGGGLLVQTATWTILLSVVLHGLSALPLAATGTGAWIGRAGKIPEKAPSPPVSRESGCATLPDAMATKGSSRNTRRPERHGPMSA